MKLPDCETPDDCRFVHGMGSSTSMYSPIEYDRNGKPVGGGMNLCVRTLSCNACGKSFIAKGYELDFAQGKVKWEVQS